MIDNINHPEHYRIFEHECIDEMIAIFGIENVIAFCKCNAWKYRYRAYAKGQFADDICKSEWYINKAIELQKELDAHTMDYSGVQSIDKDNRVVKTCEL